MTKILEPMMSELQQEAVITRRVLERMPADRSVPVIYGRGADENQFA
jgi:hypothetical protein